MANNYSQFSEVFEFKTEEAARMFVRLSEICNALDIGDIEPDGLGAMKDDYEALEPEVKRMNDLWAYVTLDRRTALLEAFSCGSFDCDPDADNPCAVWVYSEEYGNLGAVGEVAREVLAFTDDHDTVFTLTWCDYCDELRVGEFGGGWLVIHAGGVDYGNAHESAKRAKGLIEAKRKADAMGEVLDAAVEASGK